MTFNQALTDLFNQETELIIGKQRDYGKGNILKCPVDPKLGVLIRMNDKFMRLGNLLSTQSNGVNESRIDTWRDIIGYAVIGIMLEEGTFELPME